ncbi:MAG: lipoyl(octanoyl) transferase LipB [Saprospiraceae bacterium]|nr:lipoyl(octanoyl) transferase LipB [Saprospiraceae bacterium]
MQKVVIHDLGQVGFAEGWELQTLYRDKLIDRKRLLRNGGQVTREMTHYLIVCEHHPVFTLGKTGKVENLLVSEATLAEDGIDYHEINRGGDITFHGPGQLVLYPIFDLDYFFTDVHKYVRCLEEAVIKTLFKYDIHGERIKDFTGVWIKDSYKRTKKICAIGVHLSRWVTMHGLAFNINTDLSYFDMIVPCGIADKDKEVTSLATILGEEQDMIELKNCLIGHLGQVFEFEGVIDRR